MNPANELGSFIKRHINISDEDVARLIFLLRQEHGVTEVADLKFIEEANLIGLKTIPKKRLMIAIKETFSSAISRGNYRKNSRRGQAGQQRWAKAQKRDLLQLYEHYARFSPLNNDTLRGWESIALGMKNKYFFNYTAQECLNKLRDLKLQYESMKNSDGQIPQGLQRINIPNEMHRAFQSTSQNGTYQRVELRERPASVTGPTAVNPFLMTETRDMESVFQESSRNGTYQRVEPREPPVSVTGPTAVKPFLMTETRDMESVFHETSHNALTSTFEAGNWNHLAFFGAPAINNTFINNATNETENRCLVLESNIALELNNNPTILDSHNQTMSVLKRKFEEMDCHDAEVDLNIKRPNQDMVLRKQDILEVIECGDSEDDLSIKCPGQDIVSTEQDTLKVMESGGSEDDLSVRSHDQDIISSEQDILEDQ